MTKVTTYFSPKNLSISSHPWIEEQIDHKKTLLSDRILWSKKYLLGICLPCLMFHVWSDLIEFVNRCLLLSFSLKDILPPGKVSVVLIHFYDSRWDRKNRTISLLLTASFFYFLTINQWRTRRTISKRLAIFSSVFLQHRKLVYHKMVPYWVELDGRWPEILGVLLMLRKSILAIRASSTETAAPTLP